MPDVYLRESQVLALEFQERTLKFLRAGHEVSPLETVPLGLTDPIPDAGAPPSGSQPSSHPADSSDSSDTSDSEVSDVQVDELVTALVTVSTNRVHRGVALPGTGSLEAGVPPPPEGFPLSGTGSLEAGTGSLEASVPPPPQGFRAGCSRRSFQAVSYTGLSLHSMLYSERARGVACELCFPRVRGRTCPMICGSWMGSGVCAHRCAGTDPSVCEVEGHSCPRHAQGFGEGSSTPGEEAAGGVSTPPVLPPSPSL